MSSTAHTNTKTRDISYIIPFEKLKGLNANELILRTIELSFT